MGTLVEGNADDNYKIEMADFFILAAAYWTESGGAGWDASVDFNRDGEIAMGDFTILAYNFLEKPLQ